MIQNLNNAETVVPFCCPLFRTLHSFADLPLYTAFRTQKLADSKLGPYPDVEWLPHAMHDKAPCWSQRNEDCSMEHSTPPVHNVASPRFEQDMKQSGLREDSGQQCGHNGLFLSTWNIHNTERCYDTRQWPREKQLSPVHREPSILIISSHDQANVRWDNNLNKTTAETTGELALCPYLEGIHRYFACTTLHYQFEPNIFGWDPRRIKPVPWLTTRLDSKRHTAGWTWEKTETGAIINKAIQDVWK